MNRKTRQPNKRPAPPDPCPLDECLYFIEMKWVPKIMWYLREEARRFGDLRHDIGGISAKVLGQRLKTMERMGVVRREVLPTSPPQVCYSLTSLGEAFDPVFEAMARLGVRLRARFPDHLPPR
jgi:DNA-binding HxlR family transcriptional regulator